MISLLRENERTYLDRMCLVILLKLGIFQRDGPIQVYLVRGYKPEESRIGEAGAVNRT